jgi:hypothetical protein
MSLEIFIAIFLVSVLLIIFQIGSCTREIVRQLKEATKVLNGKTKES